MNPSSSMGMSMASDDITDVTKSRIKRLDAVSMLLRNVPVNERAYVKTCIQENNNLVQDWNTHVLSKIVDSDGAIQSIKISRSFTIYKSGRDIEAYIQSKNYIPNITDAHITFWKDFFNQDPREIINSGSLIVSLGWNVLRFAVQQSMADTKWELVYSLTKDPKERELLYNRNYKFLSNDILPFGLVNEKLRDTSELVQALKNTFVSFDSLPDKVTRQTLIEKLTRKISPNERYFTGLCIEKNNNLIEQWNLGTLEKLYKRSRVVEKSILYKSFCSFVEGEELLYYHKYKSHLPDITSEQLDYWITFFRTRDIKSLHQQGNFIVSIGWNTIKNAIQAYFSLNKWEAYCAGQEYSTTTLPFGLTEEEMNDYAEKVQVLNTVLIEPS